MIMNSTALKPVRLMRNRAHAGHPTKEDSKPRKARKPESSANFFRRLHSTLTTLASIEKKLTPAQWRAFLRAYSQHWLYSVEHREIVTAPNEFLKEWAQIQELGEIPMDTDTSEFHGARRYRQYESSRETARKALGLNTDEDHESPREAVRKVLGVDELY